MSGGNRTGDDLRRVAGTYWAQDRPREALEAAWAAFDLDPDRRTKSLLARLLEDYPAELQLVRRAAYLKLLVDREVEPDLISGAGWRLWLREQPYSENTSDADFAAVATRMRRDTLPLTLLRESPVYLAAAERLLIGLRRWLLLSALWQQQPEIVTALEVQMRLNGGAWPFDADEAAQLAKVDCAAMAIAYLPTRGPRQNTDTANAIDPVTQKVAAQYEGWPYPAWTRITVGEPRRLPDAIRPMDAAIAEALPVKADILIAGCGTGRQAAYVASRYADAAVTAIDVSEASLAYARRQCDELGIRNLRFLKLDLHDVAQLGQRFHSVHCGGVLHHLPNPERGFAVLADVLQPGGVMQIMVYNRLQRLVIAAARALVADLLRGPVDDDLLRRVRARLLQRSDHGPAMQAVRSRDFATLAGTYDLLLHRHEDPFDITRVGRAFKHAGLRLLQFDIPSPVVAARYDAAFPNDPVHRKIESWTRFVRTDSTAIAGHLRFWCCKSPRGAMN